MFFCLLFISLLFVVNPTRADETALAGTDTCGPAKPCPANYRCVTGVGCVSVAADDTCKCPVTPCAWPFKCDCQGGCKATPCTTTASCGSQLVNPRNKCQVMTCDRDTLTCMAVAAQCNNCHPQRGCPGAVVIAHGLPAEEEQEQEPEAGQGDTEEDYVSEQSFSAQHHHHESSETPGSNNGWVIFNIVFLCILGVVFLGVFIYAAYVMWPSKKSKNTSY